MKKLSITAIVEFTDDSRNLAHQTTVENLLVKLVHGFKAELKEIRGVSYVHMDAHVKQTQMVTPGQSGIVALGGNGPVGSKSILPHINIHHEQEEKKCSRCGTPFHISPFCAPLVCKQKAVL